MNMPENFDQSIPVDITYPFIDEALGEHASPDEAALTTQIADLLEHNIRTQYSEGNARRDVHIKATGCMRAVLQMNEDIPANLAQGIFVPGRMYEAIVRFSNGSGEPKQLSDSHGDVRGLAVKVLDIPGEKLLDTDKDARTQDFVMINKPTFFVNDPKTYLTLFEKAGGNLFSKLTIPVALGLRSTVLLAEMTGSKIANPFQVQYFSASAFQHGVGKDRLAVKFSIKPLSDAKDPMPHHPGDDFLREVMKNTLSKEDVVLSFMIQPKTSEDLSVEDCTHEWPESVAPFSEVARLILPKQDFDTEELNRLGETLSFNVWHAIVEHRPLGVVNRMRKIVYERISRVRNQMNSVVRREP